MQWRHTSLLLPVVLPTVAALALGAQAAVIGTRFLASVEARAHESIDLLAGQGLGLVREIKPAAEIVRELVDEARGTISRLNRSTYKG